MDRPGYGLSDPQPGRTIVDGVADLLAVADHLDIDTFLTVGVSTGGAYALAAAAIAPSRVRGVVACGAVTDMAHAPGPGHHARAPRPRGVDAPIAMPPWPRPRPPTAPASPTCSTGG